MLIVKTVIHLILYTLNINQNYEINKKDQLIKAIQYYDKIVDFFIFLN